MTERYQDGPETVSRESIRLFLPALANALYQLHLEPGQSGRFVEALNMTIEGLILCRKVQKPEADVLRMLASDLTDLVNENSNPASTPRLDYGHQSDEP